MKKQNVTSLILLIMLASIIAFFSLSYIFVPEKSFSEDENRVLQGSPRFTLQKLLDGTYTRQLHDYYSDQINLRSFMVELKAAFELAMGKNENNGVLLGKDGYLIETYPYTEDNYSYLQRNLLKIENLMSTLEENGIKSNSVIIPRKVDILQDKFSPYYSNERNKEAWELISDKHLTLTESLSEYQRSGHGVFYKTDHHWTAEGAYRAYYALGESIGYVPLSLDSFSLTTASDEFYGTTYSTSGFFFADPDVIKVPTLEEGRYLTEIVDINMIFDGLYDPSYLENKDKYSMFLSGNNAHVRITDTQSTEKETLLIIKDSYSHSLAPYLCEHYDLELIDPRYFNGSIEEYILSNGIENVLFLFGIDTLASANLSIR